MPRPPPAAAAAGRLPAELGREGWDLWLSLSIYARRRLAIAAGVLAAVALIWLFAVPALPCEAPGGDACPPADDAIGLVPDDALAYAHLNVDPASSQFRAADGVASQVPTLTQQAIFRLLSSLPGPRGAAVDFGRDIEPWFGGQAALAILPDGGHAALEVQLLQASEAGGASRYADSIAAGQARTSTYRGVQVELHRGGLATALVGGFLAIGTRKGVREVVDVQAGAAGVGSLADDSAASAARDQLPGERLADLYLSKAGVKRLVAEPGAPLAAFAPAVNPGASRGAAAALVASGDGLELDVRSSLDSSRLAAHPGIFTVFPSFEPTLPASLSADSLGYLGFGDPGQVISSLTRQSSADESGTVAAVGELAKPFRELGKVNVERDLLPSLGDEAALALEPSTSGSATPALAFVGAGVDDARVTEALARLQAPLAEALGSTKQAAFSRRKVGDVTAHSLRLSPTVDLTYALVGSTLVIASDPDGVRAVSTGEPGLDQADLFRRATAGLSGDASALAYLNLAGLLSLGERAGLASDPAFAAFASEFRRLEALGLAVQSSPQLLSVTIRLIVGQDSAGEGAPSD